MKGVMENAGDLERIIHETLQEMVKTQQRVGLMPVKGGAATAFVAPGSIAKSPQGGSPASPNATSKKPQTSRTRTVDDLVVAKQKKREQTILALNNK